MLFFKANTYKLTFNEPGGRNGGLVWSMLPEPHEHNGGEKAASLWNVFEIISSIGLLLTAFLQLTFTG